MQGHEAGVMSARFSADGERLLTASEDGTARAWHARTGQPLAILSGHRGWLWIPHFDGRSALTIGGDGTARLWDLAAAPLRQRLLDRDEVWSLALVAGDQAITTNRQGSLRRWAWRTGQELSSFAPARAAPFSLFASPDL